MDIRALWRDIRFLKILAQVIFIVVLALAAGYLYFNVTTNLARQGLAVGYGFMNNPASFGIGESFIPYDPSNTYARALVVGLVNTLVVSALGIVLTTIVGVLAGVARLSSNWLINRFAAAYVGVIRNTPLLLQLMFWYFGVIIQLPAVRESIELPGPVFLTQRGSMVWGEEPHTLGMAHIYHACNYLHFYGLVCIALCSETLQHSSIPVVNSAYLLSLF
jgi:general L-amino acid transport system permease protein